ncbi:hypothetical protein HHK36_007836 [Tetracentron sinense]|uniref:PH domain-containing protein n=1 Tax=Tetracentron sinense TaxID=13715 RepID=A0A834ZDL0_TETSI|nr:hypothetical protein HHK36_007836 [Tetracentron sinense]
MHPFCCVSTVSDRNPATSSSPLTEFINMPPPPPPPGTASRSNSANRSRGSSPLSSNPNNNNHSNGIRSNNHHHINKITGADHREDSATRLPAMHESQLLIADHREVKINNIVGNGVSGILYKWVNYGKGWRPRWIVLQDGVLSYYKIHGPDKIIVNQETEKGSKVIGEESLRWICRHKNGLSQLRRKPFGEVHLKVSSIRESRSDDKRFSIFTGTKRLHLRAEAREERGIWMEALQAVKDMFPRMSNSELMAPIDNVVISTEKLRQRLLEEGCNEAAIQDSEQIMRTEFSAMQSQLLLIKQKQSLLIDTLRHLEVYLIIRRKHLSNLISKFFFGFVSSACRILHILMLFEPPKLGYHRMIDLYTVLSFFCSFALVVSIKNFKAYASDPDRFEFYALPESVYFSGLCLLPFENLIFKCTEKVDLENTLVDESQRQLNEHGASSRSRQDKSSEGSASDTDDDNERHDAAEEETDDEDNTFFDTRDFLSSSSFKSNGSDLRTLSLDSDDEELHAIDSEDCVDPSIRSVGTNYPYVWRRKKLPDPVEKEKGVSLWSMIKDNIGKDLTKVCLPVYFNEPLSSLQKCFEDLEYSFLIDRANEWGKRGNSLMRILNVAAFAVSGYASTEGRNCKPFNPLLGETYEADYPDRGLRFFSEKVSFP